MPRNRKRFFDVEDDDKFETEAFAHLNDKEGEPSSMEDRNSDTNEDLDEEEEEADIAQDEDSDDEAPDDIGFHESRQSVLSQLKSALKQVDDEKRKKKEKRKLIDDHFKQQKLKKKDELAKAKLSDDFLDNIDDVIPKKVRKTVPESKKIPEKQEKTKKGKKKNTKEQSAEDEIKPEPKQEDYIALTDEPSGVQVASMKFVKKQSKTAAQRAAEFRNGRLYGKYINRESNKKRLSVKEKRRFRTS